MVSLSNVSKDSIEDWVELTLVSTLRGTEIRVINYTCNTRDSLEKSNTLK